VAGDAIASQYFTGGPMKHVDGVVALDETID
jgi:hypothetical protein